MSTDPAVAPHLLRTSPPLSRTVPTPMDEPNVPVVLASHKKYCGV